jgi:hypothetical protein
MRPCRAKKAVDEFKDPWTRVRGAHLFPGIATDGRITEVIESSALIARRD